MFIYNVGGLMGPGGAGDSYVYTFDGTSMYATMNTDWEPVGSDFEYRVSFINTGATGDFQNVYAGAVGHPKLRVNTGETPSTQLFVNTSLSSDGTTISVSVLNTVLGTEYANVITSSPASGTTMTDPRGTDNDTAYILPTAAMRTIGANLSGTGEWFEGAVWGFSLIDNAPLLDRQVMKPDLPRFLPLYSEILTGDNFALSFEFSMTRGEAASTGFFDLAGDNSNTGTFIRLYDAAHATNSNAVEISIQGGTSGILANALEDMVEGKQYNVTIAREAVSSDWDVSIDGVSKGSISASDPFYGFTNLLMSSSGVGYIQDSTEIGNISVESGFLGSVNLPLANELSIEAPIVNTPDGVNKPTLRPWQMVWDKVSDVAYEIEFEAVRVNNPKATNSIMLGNTNAGLQTTLSINDTDVTNPDRLTIAPQIGSTIVSDNFFASVAVGERFKLRCVFVITGGDLTTYMYLNDVLMDTQVNLAIPNFRFAFENIGGSDTVIPVSEMPMYNLRMVDHTSGKSVFFPMNEGSGNTFVNTDPSTQTPVMATNGGELWTDPAPTIAAGITYNGDGTYTWSSGVFNSISFANTYPLGTKLDVSLELIANTSPGQTLSVSCNGGEPFILDETPGVKTFSLLTGAGATGFLITGYFTFLGTIGSISVKESTDNYDATFGGTADWQPLRDIA